MAREELREELGTALHNALTQTVNAELQAKNAQLSGANNDVKNLLNGIDIATIFLDENLGIKRFTRQSSRIVTMDVGGQDFGGVIRGDGLVLLESLPLSLPAGAELRAAAGERLALLSGPVLNAGRIETLGLASTGKYR
jgi:two-component system CheB/CheR fusion protein